MTPEIIEQLSQRLAPSGYTDPADAEKAYPIRQDSDPNRFVTRIAPSPTGFVHIGTVYAALINYQLAKQSGGTFILRIEDTDKNREVDGSQQQIIDTLKNFGLLPDESPISETGGYGPYVQSERAALYLGYALHLLHNGRAYPCFASADELADVRAKQQAAKLRPGYYGDYALWRDRPSKDIETALADGTPFVLRFRSEGSHDRRLTYSDALKGDIQMPQNDLDIPLIKADGLPTYHLAHVVDDHLMRINLVLRGDEWLASLPLHLELAEAFGIAPFRYGHFAPISIIDNGNKRKLSKRKDKEADIAYWQQAGYLPQAIIEYLMTLASADYEAWRNEHPDAHHTEFILTLQKLAMSRSPLLDEKKLNDVSKNIVAALPQQAFESGILAWAEQYDKSWFEVLSRDPAYTKKVLAVERGGQNQRKDLACWEQSKAMYGFFFDELFEATQQHSIETELEGVSVLERTTAAEAFLKDFQLDDDQPAWFEKMKAAAEACGYATDNGAYKASPESFKGKLADYARIIRVLLTGSNRSPDLYIVMQVLGDARVRRRLGQ